MIIEYSFVTDENNRELMQAFTPEFPCLCKKTNVDGRSIKDFTWHWHPVFELDYLIDGEAEYYYPDGSIHLKRGDAIFYNLNVLHSVRVENKSSEWKQYTIFFDTAFLSGGYNSIYESRYIDPIVNSGAIQAVPIFPDSKKSIEIISCILNTVELFQNEAFGYEFEVRAEIGRFWYLFFDAVRDHLGPSEQGYHTVSTKIRPMLEFIQENYAQILRLDDIAAAGIMSTRECTRVFQKAVRMAPIQYLNYYRIHTAARSLKLSDDPISLISERCGFASAAYFSKMFKEEFGRLPKDYRKQ